MFGNLTLDAIPYHEPILVGTFIAVALLGLGLLGLVTYLGKWKYLWTEWLTTVDHKKIGIMYIIVALVMLLRGFSDAVMMRTQLAIASGDNHGFLPPHHYDQVFTAHGVIMILFMAMPLMVGLMNIVVPLQIGARDVAFPFLNSISFWLFAVGAILINLSLFVGEFARTGWLAYPPLSGLAYSPGVGVDYWIWSIQIAGIGTLLTGVNFFVTIIKMRAPGMTLMRMPAFIWSILCTNILIIAAFPVLTVTIALLTLDRYFGMHFFTNELGGNQMMYVNLIWVWGHPEVYILVLPAFGIFSEVVATYSRKRLFGYTSLVWATAVISILSFIVWLHHFFTMGAGGNVNAFFGIATMVISIPTGLKIFNWLFTMYRGRVTFSPSIIWTLGFLFTFTIGGMTGVLLAVPGADFVLHNSLFLIAHFHNVIIGGVVFGYMAGFVYWFPKAFGFKLNEKIGNSAAFCWIVGFFVAFVPLYILGFMGMTRRLNHYDNPAWQPLLIVAFFGMLIIGLGILLQLVQLFVGFLQKDKNLDVTGDPWDGRTLEWSTSSPPPFYNFAVIPHVHSRDAFWRMKEKGTADNHPTKYSDIHMPRNTGVGVYVGAFSFAFGFALIWHIWWLVAVGLVGMVVCVIVRSYDNDTDYYVPAAEVERIENLHIQAKANAKQGV
ncbi:MAG: cytochrome o ubiquinol oxidase subunit I [Gammaproteobacteria bacterium]|nr:cytochrome o ubiquinol oxidase subunit I [Gammaproteobacteria bacterium]